LKEVKDYRKQNPDLIRWKILGNNYSKNSLARLITAYDKNWRLRYGGKNNSLPITINIKPNVMKRTKHSQSPECQGSSNNPNKDLFWTW
jgi:hypothetical protein